MIAKEVRARLKVIISTYMVFFSGDAPGMPGAWWCFLLVWDHAHHGVETPAGHLGQNDDCGNGTDAGHDGCGIDCGQQSCKVHGKTTFQNARIGRATD